MSGRGLSVNKKVNKKNKEDILESEINLESLRSLISNKWFIISFLFIFSLAIHMIYKSTGLFHFDSVYDVIMVERSIRDWSLHYSYGWGAPAMVVITSFFFVIDKIITGAASAERAYFFVTFISASFASVFMYLFVKKFACRFTALCSALLFSVVPLWLTSTTYPKTHATSIFLSLLSGFLILTAKEKRSWKILAWAGAVAGISMSIRPIDGGFIIIPFAMLYLWPKIHKNRVVIDRELFSFKSAASFLIPAVGIVMLFFAPRILAMGGLDSWMSFIGAETRGGWLGFFNQQTKISFSYMTQTITLLGWVASAAGAMYLIRKRSIYILSALILWFCIMFFYIGNLSVVDSRFLLPAVLPLCILMAYGCSFAYEKHKIAGIAVLILLMLFLFSTAYPLIKARSEYSGQKEFAEFVKSRTEPDSLVFAGDNYVFIQRYGDRNTRYFGTGEETINFILKNLLNGTSVYAVESSMPFLNQEERMLLEKYFIISYIGHAQNEIYQFSALTLRRFDERLFRIQLNESSFMESIESGEIIVDKET